MVIRWATVLLVVGLGLRPGYASAPLDGNAVFEALLQQVNIPTAEQVFLRVPQSIPEALPQIPEVIEEPNQKYDPAKVKENEIRKKQIADQLEQSLRLGRSYQNVQEQITSTIQLMDHYFDQLIQSYPKATQAFLNSIYYERKHIRAKPNLIEKWNSYALAELRTNAEGRARWSVLVDPAIEKTEIVYRLKLIHEVAVHIGQQHQRIQQVGVPRYRAEEATGAFSRFTELTAAVVEKRIIDAIPMDLMVAEFRRSLGDPKKAKEMIQEMQWRKQVKFEKYPWLRNHLVYRHVHGAIPESEVKLFIAHYEEIERKRWLPKTLAMPGLRGKSFLPDGFLRTQSLPTSK